MAPRYPHQRSRWQPSQRHHRLEFFSQRSDKEGLRAFTTWPAASALFTSTYGTCFPPKSLADPSKRAVDLNISSMNAFTLYQNSRLLAAAAIPTLLSGLLLSKTNIRVMPLLPDFPHRPKPGLTNEDGSYTARSEKILATLHGSPVLPRVATPCLLLDENMSGFITGVVIPVDGGFSAYPEYNQTFITEHY